MIEVEKSVWINQDSETFSFLIRRFDNAVEYMNARWRAQAAEDLKERR